MSEAQSQVRSVDFTPEKTLEEVVKEYVLIALEYHRGNPTKTSRALGLGKHTVREWLYKWGLRKKIDWRVSA